MNFLQALFTGAKAFVKEFASVARTIVREILTELDQSAFGRSATRLIDGLADRLFAKARDLSDEERELGAKFMRDGYRTEADAERLREIAVERETVRARMDRENAERSAQDLRDHADETLVALLDDDELSSSVGILAAKVCPSCGGTMRIRQRPVESKSGTRRFYWQCSAPKVPPCPYVNLDLSKGNAGVVRLANPDLDTPKEQRRAAWNRPDQVS